MTKLKNLQRIHDRIEVAQEIIDTTMDKCAMSLTTLEREKLSETWDKLAEISNELDEWCEHIQNPEDND